MQLAFCLYKYFPYGGLQRDFLRIALECQQRGHAIRVYTLEWDGQKPEGFDVVVVPVKAISNHRLYRKYTQWVEADLLRRPADRVIGFNKMPGLDVYYAADPCFEEKARILRNPLYRLGARYKHFSEYERRVFDADSRTRILLIAPTQKPRFQRYYGTPDSRFHLLPPGLSPERKRPADSAELRAQLREEFSVRNDEFLVLQVGSGFKTKGLDRSLIALAALPEALRLRTRFIAIGRDDAAPFIQKSRSLGVLANVQILPGRDDIQRFMLGADLLIHPAYHEAGGIVLLEALVSGLPVLATDICGFAHFIEEADAGALIPSPFSQSSLNTQLERMLNDPASRARWERNGLAFAENADIYDMPSHAADVILETVP